MRALLDQQPDRSYHCITLIDVLEHVASPSYVLRSAARILKPGGMMFLDVPNAEAGCDEMSRHFYLFPEACLRSKLERLGFVEYRAVHLSDRYNPDDPAFADRFLQIFVRKPG